MEGGVEMEQLVLPSGYRFIPTDKELILYYLKNKILGLDLPANIIPTIDVFSCNPDQLPLNEFKYGRSNEWYFFSNRRKGIILTEDGYYSVSSRRFVYNQNKLIIGSVRTLDFYHGRPVRGTKSQWCVHEFRANPRLFRLTEEKINNFVACKIVRKDLELKNQMEKKMEDGEFESNTSQDETEDVESD